MKTVCWGGELTQRKKGGKHLIKASGDVPQPSQGNKFYTFARCRHLFSSLERCIPLKATEFKSNMALSENGIKGWTINLSYSQVTGHLRAKILMGSFSPFLLPCSRCMIHGLSFSGLHFHLIAFSLLLLSDSSEKQGAKLFWRMSTVNYVIMLKFN